VAFATAADRWLGFRRTGGATQMNRVYATRATASKSTKALR
jgi:hypothetical protein